jgi:hypothetical protein
MTKRLLNLTTVGLLVIVAGGMVAGLTFHFTKLNDESLEQGLSRQGRIISIYESSTAPDTKVRYTAQIQADLATSEEDTLISIVEVDIPRDFSAELAIGSQIPLLVLPGNPPSVRLKTQTKETSYEVGYILATTLSILGLVLIWMNRSKNDLRSTWRGRTVQLPRGPTLSDSLQKIAVKSTVLYDGPFEFSYAEEKTRIDLNDGTSLRINQYRPLAEIALEVPEQDILKILRTAKSDWNLPAGADAKTALTHLLEEGKITNTDQFFINRNHLGILSRDEVDNGHWHSWVRGVWQLSSTGRILAGLLSANPAFVRKAADKVLYHDDLSLVASLAPHLPKIRKSPSGTPDDKRTLGLAIELIGDLHDKKCPCQTYASHPFFSPKLLLEKKKMKKEKPEGKDASSAADKLCCNYCKRIYSVTTKVHSGQQQFHWKQLTGPETK